MNPFAEKYKTWSNAKLLEVIDLPENYQPDAVSAAQAEIATRKVSAEDLEEIRTERQAQIDEKGAKAAKLRVLEDKVRSAGAEFALFVRPNITPTPLNKVIAAISIFFGGLGLYEAYRLIRYIIDIILYHWQFFFALEIPRAFQAFYLPLTALLFWKKNEMGLDIPGYLPGLCMRRHNCFYHYRNSEK